MSTEKMRMKAFSRPARQIVRDHQLGVLPGLEGDLIGLELAGILKRANIQVRECTVDRIRTCLARSGTSINELRKEIAKIIADTADG